MPYLTQKIHRCIYLLSITFYNKQIKYNIKKKQFDALGMLRYLILFYYFNQSILSMDYLNVKIFLCTVCILENIQLD